MRTAAMTRSNTLRFAFFSFRPFAGDFRRYLMEALHGAGRPSVHIYLRRDDMEIRYSDNFAAAIPMASLSEVAAHLRQFFGNDPGVIVNSAGNSAPDALLQLWRQLSSYIWVYDVYDWLLYDAAGLRRMQWWITDQAYKAIATCCCILSQDLCSRYPTSFHLENASHLHPSGRQKIFGNRMVVTASFDRRTDFDLIQAIAEQMPDIAIDLYGSVFDDDPTTLNAISRLTTSHKNIIYYGRFDLDKLQHILDNYMIGLMPYRVDCVTTRFINPDKLFHYLCAGLEVIASPIPAVRHYSAYVYQANDAKAVVAAIEQITKMDERRNPGNLNERLNWDIRARELCHSMESYLR